MRQLNYNNLLKVTQLENGGDMIWIEGAWLQKPTLNSVTVCFSSLSPHQNPLQHRLPGSTQFLTQEVWLENLHF